MLTDACQSCGACPVGEPLPRPDKQLPSFGRSLLLAVAGAFLVLALLSQTIIALVARAPLSLGFWSWVAAAETAAWRLKWFMIPVTILVLYCGRKLYRSVRQSPMRFCGQRYALSGYVACSAVPLLVLILIGVTVPTRLEHRQWGIQAAENAQGHAYALLFLEYQQMFGKIPSDKKALKDLPDPDGSIAALLKDIEGAEYKATAEVAAMPTQNPRPLRGGVIRNASISTSPDGPLGEGLTFTNYELRLPGADKVLNTEDDLIVRDGLVSNASDDPQHNVTKPGSAQARRP